MFLLYIKQLLLCQGGIHQLPTSGQPISPIDQHFSIFYRVPARVTSLKEGRPRIRNSILAQPDGFYFRFLEVPVQCLDTHLSRPKAIHLIRAWRVVVYHCKIGASTNCQKSIFDILLCHVCNWCMPYKYSAKSNSMFAFLHVLFVHVTKQAFCCIAVFYNIFNRRDDSSILKN